MKILALIFCLSSLAIAQDEIKYFFALPSHGAKFDNDDAKMIEAEEQRKIDATKHLPINQFNPPEPELIWVKAGKQIDAASILVTYGPATPKKQADGSYLYSKGPQASVIRCIAACEVTPPIGETVAMWVYPFGEYTWQGKKIKRYTADQMKAIALSYAEWEKK